MISGETLREFRARREADGESPQDTGKRLEVDGDSVIATAMDEWGMGGADAAAFIIGLLVGLDCAQLPTDV